jgi:hypothetical protein
VFDAADEPVVTETPSPISVESIPMQLWPLLSARAFEFDLQLFFEKQLFKIGQDASCRPKQSALLRCVPTESQAPFLQIRLSSNHTHSLEFTNIGR